LGQSEYHNMHFDLDSILIPTNDLEDLVLPFSNDEIDEVVSNLKPDKSPGPDGFNTYFMNKCWAVIKHDFYDHCGGGGQGGGLNHEICLQITNGSYITLIPKIDTPSKVGNFRPISLFNNSVKLLTKLFTKRMQIVVLRAVHQNQYGFIKGRSI
jgi:hypothetical protein